MLRVDLSDVEPGAARRLLAEFEAGLDDARELGDAERVELLADLARRVCLELALVDSLPAQSRARLIEIGTVCQIHAAALDQQAA